MTNRTGLMLVATLLVLTCSVFAEAGSIWAKRGKNTRDLYADDIARNIGDVLTISISEDSKVDNKAKRDLKKETNRSTTFDGQLNIDHVLPSMPGLTMSAGSSNELTSKADFKDERSFVDKITAVVIDVLPNGNLVVMGTRLRTIAGDVQTIEVSGVVRPSDIAFDNTVKSEQVADFHLITKNSGVAAPYNKQGWLGSIFDILWPF